MYKLFAANQYGDEIEITHNSMWTVKSLDGFDPPDSQINTQRLAGYDGSVFNSSYIEERTITITLAINAPCERNRIELYRYFKTKFVVRLRYVTETRDVYIDGFVQSLQVDYFKKKELAQIVIKCPSPALNGTVKNVQEFTSVDPLFEFPFEIVTPIPFSEIVVGQEKSIINSGDLETGCMIDIHALGPVTTPKVYNTGTGDFMILNTTMLEGDSIIINTRKGQKSIKLIRNGAESNLISALAEGSTWFVLAPGDNVFASNADGNPEYMYITFTLVDQFEGV